MNTLKLIIASCVGLTLVSFANFDLTKLMVTEVERSDTLGEHYAYGSNGQWAMIRNGQLLAYQDSELLFQDQVPINNNSSLSFSNDGATAFYGATAWDLASGERKNPTIGKALVSDLMLDYSIDPRHWEPKLSRWNSDGSLLFTTAHFAPYLANEGYELPEDVPESRLLVIDGKTNKVLHVLSKNEAFGNTIATMNNKGILVNKSLKVWDLATGKKVYHDQNSKYPAYAQIRTDPKNESFIIFDANGQVSILDCESFEVLEGFSATTKGLIDIQIHPKLPLFVLANKNGELRAYRLQNDLWQPLNVKAPKVESLKGVHFDPDGNLHLHATIMKGDRRAEQHIVCTLEVVE